MATATVIDAITNVRTVPYTHGVATVPGTIVLGNGNVLIAINAKALSVENAYVIEGKVTMPKTSGLAINMGDAVYWDDGASEVNKTVAGNTACGHCVKSAGASDTTVDIFLRGYVKA